MPKIKKKSTIPNEVSKKRDQKKNHNKKVLDKTDGNSCVCKKLESIVEKLQSLSEKLAAESPCDSYDDFSKYISSLLRGLPQKTALNLKRKLVNDVLEVVNAQGDDDPSFFSFTNKRYIPNAVSVSHQESTIPHSATTSQCATRDLSLLAEAEPSRESSRELRKSGIKRSPMPAAARTRAQKRKQSFNESNSKRIATEIEDCLPVDEPLPEEVNEASSSFRSLPAQDENVTLIDFEEGNELCEMKYDQEIVKDITFDLVKQETPDPLGETNDIVEDIAQLFLCDVCLTQCPSREALTQHFQQEHPGSIERRKDINIVDIKTKEVQKWVDDSFELNEKEVCNTVAADADLEIVGSSAIEAIKQGDFNVDSNKAETNNCNDESPIKILGIQELDENCREEENVDNSSFHLELDDSGVSNDGAVDLDMEGVANLNSEGINQNDLTSSNDNGDNCNPIDGSHTNMNDVAAGSDMTAAASSEVINQNDLTRTNDKGVINKPTDGSQIKILGVQELGEKSRSIENTAARPLQQVRKKYVCGQRKKNYCLYCKKIYTNVLRHLVQVHRNEKEMGQYLITCNKETRKKLMRTIINKGNYQYNMSLIAKGQKPVKGESAVDVEKNVICKNCLGLYKKRTIYRHYKRCFTKTDGKTSIRESKNRMISYAPIPPQASKALHDDIIKHMIKDCVSQVAQSDPLILTFGSKTYEEGKAVNKIRNVISKMREMSKILILMKEKHERIKTFEDCFGPVYFNDILDIVKKIGKHADNDGVCRKINIRRVRTSLNECANILKETINKTDSLLPEEKNKKRMLADDFIELLRTNWKLDLGYKLYKRPGMTDLQSIVPNSDDVILVFKYINKLYETLVKKLKNDPTTENYCVLAKRCIVQLAILNRRKPDDISHALLEHYNEKCTVSRSDFSENCVEEFKVPGSSSGYEFCLLTKPMVQAIDALISTRDQLKITSKYLFLQKSNTDNSKEEEVLNIEETVNEVRINIRFLLKNPKHFTHKTLINHGVDQMILLKTIVPETHLDDVTMALAFIAKSYEFLIKELEANPTPARYCVLAKRCIAHLIILNRCKQSNVTEALLEKYEQIMETMSDTSDKCVRVYTFRALGNYKTTLLLNNQMKMAIDTLVASRKPLQITDKYLFSQPNPSTDTKEEVFNGEEVINELSKTLTFQLKVPDSFTVAGLRHHKVEEERLLKFIVPCSEDISSLLIEINNTYEVLKKELNENPTAIKYSKLAKICIAHLIILNQCEQTEVTCSLMENYDQIKNVSRDNVEVFDFPGSENSFTLLVSKPMKELIDALVRSRNQLGIVSKYLFAVPNGNEEKSVFSAENAANSLKHICTFELKQPFNFTVDALKNHNVNQEALFSTSSNIDSEILSSLSKENTLKKVHSTEHTLKTSEITDVSVKNSDSIEIIISPKNTEKKAEKSDGGHTLQQSQESTFASKFAKFCLPDLNSDSDSEDTCKTPIVRKRWSTEEKDVVYKYFGRHLLNFQNPGRQEIGKLLQKEPVLKNRSLDQVNAYVNNIVTEKVKLTPPVVKRIKELCS